MNNLRESKIKLSIYFLVVILVSLNPKPASALTRPNILEPLKQKIDSFINSITIPDFIQIVEDVFNNSSSNSESETSQKTAKVLENRPLGEYGITEDRAEQATRDSAKDAAAQATLSEEAQEKLKETAAAIEASVETNVALGEESQTLDVTQQILQNLSQQEALNAAQIGTIVQQNQQAQVDRAINNVLAAEQAEELSEMNTAKRRQSSAASNASTAQWGLISLPGLTNSYQ